MKAEFEAQQKKGGLAGMIGGGGGGGQQGGNPLGDFDMASSGGLEQEGRRQGRWRGRRRGCGEEPGCQEMSTFMV